MLLTLESRSLVIAASGTAVTPSGSEAAAARPTGATKRTRAARDHRERSFIWRDGSTAVERIGGGDACPRFASVAVPRQRARHGMTCVVAGPLRTGGE